MDNNEEKVCCNRCGDTIPFKETVYRIAFPTQVCRMSPEHPYGKVMTYYSLCGSCVATLLAFHYLNKESPSEVLEMTRHWKKPDGEPNFKVNDGT